MNIALTLDRLRSDAEVAHDPAARGALCAFSGGDAS